jgi:3-hydroxyanthranilate 3,4-dioxygenase
MSFVPPFHLKGWIDAHRDQLKPPVGNKALWADGGFLVMVVGGPNARTDYHVNPAEELFYQVEGDINLRLIVDGQPRDVPLREGEIFLLPPKVPHSPQRPAGTVGLVVEYRKGQDEDHALRWYCKGCGAIVHEEAFRPQDLGEQIKKMLAKWNGDESLRTCKKCGMKH